MVLTQKYVNIISYNIVACAIEVHKQLGPGLFESVYETCLIEELINAGLEVERQVNVPITYKEKKLGCHLTLDLLVNNLVVVELKAVEVMIPIFKAQLLSYLKLTNKPKGLLINFNCGKIREDLVPLVTHVFSDLSKE